MLRIACRELAQFAPFASRASGRGAEALSVGGDALMPRMATLWQETLPRTGSMAGLFSTRRAFSSSSEEGGKKSENPEADKTIQSWSSFLQKDDAKQTTSPDAISPAESSSESKGGEQQTDFSFLRTRDATTTGSGGPNASPHRPLRSDEGFRYQAPDLETIRLNPYRLYYPGQWYQPEELNPLSLKSTPHASQKIHRKPVDPAAIEEQLDVRNLRLLNQYITPLGRIIPKRKTKLPARLQRKVSRMIKTARCLGIFSYSGKLPEFQRKKNPYT